MELPLAFPAAVTEIACPTMAAVKQLSDDVRTAVPVAIAPIAVRVEGAESQRNAEGAEIPVDPMF